MSSATTPGASTRRNMTSIGRDLFDGRVIYCVVPVNVVMSDLARALAEDHGIAIPIPTPTQPVIRPPKRPCILLHCDKTGYLVLPMATFKKSNPQTWDLLLRAIVVPVGSPSTVLPTMRDRERFDTEPTWTHPEGAATYIIPYAFRLPLRTAVEPDNYQIPPDDFVRLQEYCDNTTARLGALGKDAVRRLLESYSERYCSVPQSPTSQETLSSPATSAVSTLNPRAASFVSWIPGAPKPVDHLSPQEILHLVGRELISACEAAVRDGRVPGPSGQVLLDNRASPGETENAHRARERRAPAQAAEDVGEKENHPP